MRALAFAIVLSGTVIGCGGDSSMTMSLGAEERTELCSEYCAYEVSCGAADEAACRDWCGALAELIRGDAARSLLACYLDSACDAAAESVCLSEVIDRTDPTATYDEAARSCHATASRCEVSYGCDATYFVLLSDETLASLIDCFGLGCGEVELCLVGVFS